jgi:hypothetical protein
MSDAGGMSAADKAVDEDTGAAAAERRRRAARRVQPPAKPRPGRDWGEG